jgi:methionyl-tRNA formyltransferase
MTDGPTKQLIEANVAQSALNSSGSVKHGRPTIVFVGAHMESHAPFRHLIQQGYRILGLVTLDSAALQKMSGAVDLARVAEAARIPVLRVHNVNEPNCVTWIREKRPDLLLVVGWTQLVKDELLRVPKFACLGFHASLLPKYRGRAPVNWAIILGETITGNTMILLEPEADTGDIVAQKTIEIRDEDDCRTIYEKVALTEVEMLDEILPMVQKGILPRRKQDDSQATVMPRRRPEDGRIDWRRSTREICNWIRALTEPYPGAFSVLHGRKVWIWAARADCTRPTHPKFKPGEVTQDQEGWPLVAAKEGWIRILLAQEEGGPKLSGKSAGETFLVGGSAFAEVTEAAP